MTQRVRFTLGMALVAALFSQAFAAEPAKPEPFMRETLHHAEATIEAIDAKTRTVSVRGAAGLSTFVAGPEVRNFANMKVGEKIRISYYEGIAAEIRKKDAPKTKESVEVSTAIGAPAGAKPAGAEGRAQTATVTIQSVDTKANSVTFKKQDGSSRTLHVTLADGQAFIRTLKKGDTVDVVYVEAVAVEVVPAK